MTMDNRTKKRVESAGWEIGDAVEFLGLSAEEAALMEIRFKLIRPAVREQRSGEPTPLAAIILDTKSCNLEARYSAESTALAVPAESS